MFLGSVFPSLARIYFFPYFFSSLLLAEFCGRYIAALPRSGMSLEAAAGGLALLWGGMKSTCLALPGVRGCSPGLCVACPRDSWFLKAFLSLSFFFFADGIGDVLSHLRKQVEILFNTRYGKMVINTCSSCRVPASAAGSS